MNVADQKLFRELFEQTYSELVAYARRRTVAIADADDVVSEVFAIAWRRRADIDPTGSPLPWLYGIAGNVLRNQRRAGGRRLQLVDRLENEPKAQQGGSAIQLAIDPADRAGADLRAALGDLSFDDQELLRLVAWEGLSHAEVGQVLDCSSNAVAVRLHRARQRLQERLTDRFPEETSP